MDKKEIEIPLGAFDSELMHQEINIPEGFEAEIKGNKIILKKTESEDERIRKAIISGMTALKEQGKETFAAIHINDCIAWLEKRGEKEKFIKKELGFIRDYREEAIRRLHELEKQGEQKSVNKVEPKFKVGDWVVYDNKIFCHIDNIHQGKESLMYTITDANNMTRSYAAKGFDNNAHLWTIQDARDGDVLKEDSCIFILQKLNDNNTAAKTYCTLHDDGDFEDGSMLYFDVDNTKPATKEQRDLLFLKMKEAGYKWDDEKKELRKIEQKPAWSEGDETLLSSVINSLLIFEDSGASKMKIDWLKSLKQRLKE